MEQGIGAIVVVVVGAIVVVVTGGATVVEVGGGLEVVLAGAGVVPIVTHPSPVQVSFSPQTSPHARQFVVVPRGTQTPLQQVLPGASAH
ncbi:MAG: hypothetical protein AB7V46_12730 [Thermomicrobiales bacterium]